MIQDLLEFQHARRRGRVARVLSLVTRKRGRMPILEDVLASTGTLGQSYVGVRPIEVGRIVGSESRTREFDRDFLPLRGFLKDRWTRVNEAWQATSRSRRSASSSWTDGTTCATAGTGCPSLDSTPSRTSTPRS